MYIYIIAYAIYTYIYNIYFYPFFFTINIDFTFISGSYTADIFLLSSENSLCVKSSSVAYVKISSIGEDSFNNAQ